ncbi:hypothetical protein [Nocardia brasiliensis]
MRLRTASVLVFAAIMGSGLLAAGSATANPIGLGGFGSVQGEGCVPPPLGSDGKPLPPPVGPDGKPSPPPSDLNGKPCPPPGR